MRVVKMRKEDVDEIFRLVSPLVPPNKHKELREKLEKLEEDELPEVYTPELLINAIGRILETLAVRKTKGTDLEDLSKEIGWVVKGIYYLTIAPKIRELIVSGQIRRAGYGDE